MYEHKKYLRKGGDYDFFQFYEKTKYFFKKGYRYEEQQKTMLLCALNIEACAARNT